MNKQFYLLIFLCTVFIISCEKSSPTSALPLPGPPTFSGNWIGVASNITFSLVEKDNKLYGTCIFINLNVVANGEQNYPNVTIRLEKQGFLPATYIGAFIHPDTIDGNMNGSGFVNANMVFARR